MKTTQLFKTRMLSIFFPWGYSHYDDCYTGETPFLGGTRIVIQIHFDGWGEDDSLISIVIVSSDTVFTDMLGYFKGVMNVACPYLYSDDTMLSEKFDVIDFKLNKSYTTSKRDSYGISFYEHYSDNDGYYMPILLDWIVVDDDEENKDETAAQNNG